MNDDRLGDAMRTTVTRGKRTVIISTIMRTSSAMSNSEFEFPETRVWVGEKGELGLSPQPNYGEENGGSTMMKQHLKVVRRVRKKLEELAKTE